MSLIALEINDAGLALVRGEELALESPGVAVLEGKDWLLGEPAMRQLRLRPGRVMTRFWEQLSLDPLPSPTRDVRTQADLAFIHLRSLWEGLPADTRQEVILSVPGTYNRDQLALLLGIARECGIQVCGLVDTSVAAATVASPGKSLLHLDVHLHRAILSQLHQGEQIRRERVDSIATVGLSSLADSWCNRIADVFVRNTRFDPMHQAESEQQMYDKLPGWLATLEQEGSALLEIDARGKSHQLILKREQLLQASEESFRQVVEQVRARTGDAGCLVQITHRARTLPGLADALRQVDGCQVFIQEPQAGARGALLHAEAIRSLPDNIRFVTSLPWHPSRVLREDGSAQASPSEAVSHTRGAASHLVWHGIAYRIDAAWQFQGESQGMGPASGPVSDSHALAHFAPHQGSVLFTPRAGVAALVNGETVSAPTLLQAGDRILLADGRHELLAIRLGA